MVSNRFGLGRGVDALFSKMDSSFFAKLNIEQITPNPFQPRTNFNKSELNDLADSISQYGIIQPLTVRKLEENKYQIISGERRFLASKIAGLKTIPAYIKQAKDNEMLELALIENIQREDLDPIEIGISYKTLIDELQITQEKLSKKIGKKRSTISNYLRLLKLNPIIQSGIKDGFISMGHGRAMINIDDEKMQINIYEKIISKNLSVRNTEKLIQSLKKEGSLKIQDKIQIPSNSKKNITKLEKKINKKIKVVFNKDKSGKIIIPFDSIEDLNSLNKKINE